MVDKKYDYYINLISSIMNFMDVVEGVFVSNDRMVENLKKAEEITKELISFPREVQIDALTNFFIGVGIEKIGQQKVVTYKGMGFQVKNTGSPKRLDEIYQPRSFKDIQEYLIQNDIYNKKMRETRQ